MTSGQRALRILFYSAWAVLLTAFTYILGAAPLKLLRVRAGRIGYWLIGIAISTGFYFADVKIMGLVFLSLVVLMGVFGELEDGGFGFLVSAFSTILINSLLAASALAVWVSRAGAKWNQQILSYMEESLKPLTQINPHLQVNVHDLVIQLPSVAVILWASAIYLAVFLDPRMNGGIPSSEHSAQMRLQLSRFRVPDFVVWAFIASLLGAFGGFGKSGLEALAVNVMNVCILLFFFQGIAVVARFFESFRMGAIWQLIFMVLIVLHLFLFVSVLGLMDYWLDFRMRLDKRGQALNREV